MLEALQEVDVQPPLVAALRARPLKRLLIENLMRVLLRKSGGHRSRLRAASTDHDRHALPAAALSPTA